VPQLHSGFLFLALPPKNSINKCPLETSVVFGSYACMLCVSSPLYHLLYLTRKTQVFSPKWLFLQGLREALLLRPKETLELIHSLFNRKRVCLSIFPRATFVHSKNPATPQ
jgi:hypothetical protein